MALNYSPRSLVFGNIVRYALPTLVASVVAGAFGILALADHYAYRELRIQTLALKNQIGSAVTVFQYGTIGVIDTSARTLSVRMESKVAPDGPPIVFTLRVTNGTVIAREELTGNGSVYTAISTDASRSFEDLKVGDRIAFLMTFSADASPEATAIFFGTPL